MTLEQGDLLYNRYRILDILGRGGMGSVYHAIDESLGVEVAVKENLFVTEEYEKQFRLEAVILASLRHSNLPRVTDHFAIEGQGQYLVMDYIEGRDLRHLMESGPLPEAEAVRIGVAVCGALTYLHTHKRPVLHRDIKPGNVRIAPDGHVYLVDFGLAKMSNLDEHTMSGARAMTPGYSPPEQYGTSRTDARTDVYSLGATLYAALTGFIPEDGLARVVDEVKLTPLRKRNPKVSPELAAVIEKAMEPQSNNRYQSAEEFGRALQGMDPLKADEPAKAESASQPVNSSEASAEKISTQRPAKRRSSAGGWLFIFVLLIALGGGLAWLVNNPQYAPESLRGMLAFIITPTAPAEPSSTPVPPTLAVAETTPTQTSTAEAQVTAENTATPIQQQETSTVTPAPSDATEVVPGPTVSGGLGEIAFASLQNNTSQIYISNADGTNLHPLTNELTGACQPAWSPDGKKLAYISPCAGKNDQYLQSSLFVFDLESNESQQLLADSGSFEPAWSPDGTKIAFASLREGFLAIYTINLGDKTVTALTPPSNTLQSRQPAWSPDGSQIAYTVKRSGIFRIWTMNADGSNQLQLFRAGGSNADYLPVWSPDGLSIFFSESNSEITAPSSLRRFILGSDQTPEVLPIQQPVVDVSFSPDGNWIVYESPNTRNLLIYNLSGSTLPQPLRLVDNNTTDFDPAWRPTTPQ
jgi:serine/threonine-protein kinase